MVAIYGAVGCSDSSYKCRSTKSDRLPRNAIKKWADFYEARAKSQTDFLGKMEDLHGPAHSDLQGPDRHMMLPICWKLIGVAK